MVSIPKRDQAPTQPDNLNLGVFTKKSLTLGKSYGIRHRQETPAPIQPTQPISQQAANLRGPQHPGEAGPTVGDGDSCTNSIFSASDFGLEHSYVTG